VQFAIELAVLMVALLFVGNVAFPYLPGVLLVLVIQMFFIYGIALALGAMNVYFRDVQHFIGILLQIWFYATPIVYPISTVHDALKSRPELFTLYKLNPMVRFVEAYRDCLYDLRFPPLLDILYLLGVSAATLALGVYVFSKLEPKLAEEL